VSRVFSALIPLGLLILAGCGTPAQSAAPQAGSGPAPLVHLPRDQAAHPSSANEWWYVVGHLRSDGQRFGYEMTVFRLSHLHPPGSAAGSPPITLYRTDLAITDQNHKTFHQKISYYFPQSAHMSSTSLNVDAGTAHLSGSSPSAMHLRFSMPAGSANFSLSSRRPAMDVGGRGFIRFSNGFTYYYSLTDIATSGTLTVHGKRYRISGTSWLDHQWGNWTWAGSGGWIWMALQLNNGTQLSVFDVRSSSGSIRAASILLPNGKQRTLHAVTFTPLATWKSPHTGADYPSGFVVSIPGIQARLRVLPVVKDQELWLPSQPQGSYWEGSSTVTGTWKGRKVSGLAYTELTGYAK
jgi:predicted secreted hydrolase